MDLPAPSDRRLLFELAQLGPALDGYPVGPLLDVFVSAEQRERVSAHRLVDRCLASWIASLGHTLQLEQISDDEGVLNRIQERQRGTRDALARMQRVLSKVDLVPPAR